MEQTTPPAFSNPQQIKLDPGLYLVPTPIGNLRDISLRALDVLQGCSAVLCEDSRVTGKLLKAYNIQKKKIIYNDHSSTETRAYIIEKIKQGEALALVSDAGTPLISDPGHKLVQHCLVDNLYVTALPGANAVLPALQLSGLPSGKFVFAGFLPHKDKATHDILQEYRGYHETLIFYETATRIERTLEGVKEIYGDRSLAVIREISKLYEEGLRGTAADVLEKIKSNPPKGEIVLVIEGAQKEAGDFDLEALIRQALNNGESNKDLAARLAAETGLKKRDIYTRALEIDS